MLSVARSSLWLLAIAAVLGARFWMDRDLISGQRPEIPVQTLDGIAYADLIKPGRTGLIYFWATWCPVCRVTQGAVQSVSRDYAVVSVALQSGSGEDLRAYAKASQLDVPIVPDPDGALAGSFGLRGVPTVFVVDRGGTIRFATAGYTSELGMRLRLWFAERGW